MTHQFRFPHSLCIRRCVSMAPHKEKYAVIILDAMMVLTITQELFVLMILQYVNLVFTLMWFRELTTSLPTHKTSNYAKMHTYHPYWQWYSCWLSSDYYLQNMFSGFGALTFKDASTKNEDGYFTVQQPVGSVQIWSAGNANLGVHSIVCSPGWVIDVCVQGGLDRSKIFEKDDI